MKNKKTILIFLFVFFLLASILRFYNIQITARFTRDESSDLVKMKNIIDNKDLTLIGPTAEGNTGIFSSLTYYLSLPFVYLSHNNPISPAWATAFYGLITVILIWMFLIKQKKLWLPLLFLPVIFSPFIETSRWAWNPHFILFWQIIGLMILSSKMSFKFILAGIIFGLTIHQHWYAFFSCLGIILLVFIKDRKIKAVINFITGLFISIIPFIIFDLTHPPGLFLSRMLFFSPISPNRDFTIINAIIKLLNTPYQFINYLTFQQTVISLIVIFPVFILIIKNIYSKQKTSNILLLPVLLQFFGLSLISTPVADRYFIPSVLFFILWLSDNLKNRLSKLIIILLIISSCFSLPKLIFQPDHNRNIAAIEKITEIIKNEVSLTNQKFNLLVIQSPDGNTKGAKFRDLLEIQKIYPLPETDYDNPEILFIISYSQNWDSIKDDPAYEMSHFRSHTPNNSWRIDNSDWILYKVSQQP